MNAWDIYLGRRLIDTVFYMKGISAEEVRISLINHDGYAPRITVRQQK